MSVFGDYKSYKKFEPTYEKWKNERNVAEAKRLEYIKLHPELRKDDDVKRGQVLLRAIDIMDEYSQRRSENMEVATENITSIALEFAFVGGASLAGLIGATKAGAKFFNKLVNINKKYSRTISQLIPMLIGGVTGTLVAFPMMAWAAKAEVSASRKGRFEAMRKELSNPNGFAILTQEQEEEAKNIAQNIQLKDDQENKIKSKFTNGINTLKEMAIDSKEYIKQRREFDFEEKQTLAHIDDNADKKDIDSAKRDKQLLTSLVEKIDIASQDYAENAELATQAAVLTIGAAGGLFSMGIDALLNKLKVSSAAKISFITKALSFAAFLGMGIYSAQIQKHASRVGRYKAKQEILNNPDNFIYVDENKLKDIGNIEAKELKKQSIIEFLKTAYKNNKEYKQYQKNAGKEERKFYQATEQINLSENQIKDAKKLQKNTFKTFNKVDEMSQKYAESVEALGQSVGYPVSMIGGIVGIILALPFLQKRANTKLEQVENMAKYFGTTLLTAMVPQMLLNTYITKEQKKASRIANMLAINELNDYRLYK